MDHRLKIIKRTEENLCELELEKDFLDVTPEAKPIKLKIDKLDVVRVENVCSSKDTVNRMKSQATNWKKIFANHISVKRHIQKYTSLSRLHQTTQ